MAYAPLTGYLTQLITQSGQVASDYYIKFYIANTTTPLSMATDQTGGTLLAKAKFNNNGIPISNPLDNSTEFIPHLNQSYRLVVYLNAADADANNTAESYVNIPEIYPLLSESNVGTGADQIPLNRDLPSTNFEGISAAITAVVAAPINYPNNTGVATLSYRTASECAALSIDYPDGGASNYTIENIGSPDGHANHSAGTKQLSLAVNEVVKLKQFGCIGNNSFVNTLPAQAALNFINLTGVSLDIGFGFFKTGAIGLTTTKPISIYGLTEESSKFIFEGTNGLNFIQNNYDHFINLKYFSIQTNSVATGMGLTIDARPQLVTTDGVTLIQPRDVKRANIENIYIGGVTKDKSFVKCYDFISFGWFDMTGIRTRGLQPANQFTTSPLGDGIVIRGDGQPVEINITDWRGYYHKDCVRTPDAVEGLFIDKFNLVAVVNGFNLGKAAADSLGSADPSTLGFTITNGHVNGTGVHLDYGEKSNQNITSNLLCYVRNATFTTGDTNAVILRSGGNNTFNNLEVIVIDNLVSRSSFTPVKFEGQNTNSLNGLSVNIGLSTQIGALVDARTSEKCSFSNVSVAKGATGTVQNIYKTDNTTKNCYFSAPLSKILSDGMVDNGDTSVINTEDQNTYDIEYSYTGLIGMVGGSATETIGFGIPAWMLSKKSTNVSVSPSSLMGGAPFNVFYDEGASTDIAAVIKFYRNDGGNTTAGAVRINLKIKPG